MAIPLTLVACWSDLGDRAQAGYCRLGMSFLRQVNEEILCAKAIAVSAESGAAWVGDTCISTILPQYASLIVVLEIALQDFIKHPFPQSRIPSWKHDLDPLVKVARHPVGTAQIQIGLAIVLEVEDPTVLQKSSYNTAHANAIGSGRLRWAARRRHRG